MAKKPPFTKSTSKKKPASNKLDDAEKVSRLIPASGKDVKVIFVRLNVEGWRELRKLAAEDDTSVQALMIESINDLFQKRGRKEIAANPLS
jgi:hypothetical protein